MNRITCEGHPVPRWTCWGKKTQPMVRGICYANLKEWFPTPYAWSRLPHHRTDFHARLNAQAKDYPELNKNWLFHWVNECLEGHNAWTRKG